MIRLATELEINDWDKLIQSNSDGGHIYQSKEWSQIKETNGWEPIYCIYEAAGCVVAFVLQKKPASILGNIYYCSKGPGVFANYQSDDGSSAHFKEFLIDLKSFIKKQDSRAILVKLEPELDADDKLDFKSLGLLKSNADLQFKATIFVDISNSEEEILANFKQKTRYNIRLAERKGVKIEHREMNDEGVDLMYELMQATQKRGGFFLRSKEYFGNYWKQLYKDGMGQFLVATHEGDVIGAVYATVFGTKAYYKDGGSFEIKRNLMAPYLLQWEATKWAKSKGANSYDLVAVPPKSELENEKHSQHGLYLFKRGFNEEVTEFKGCWDLPINQQKYRLWIKQEANFLKLYAKMKKNLFW
jgi:lipid II:glycine glycyltransferase (peptidoglycan interpeptide bridge formation enzyme)